MCGGKFVAEGWHVVRSIFVSLGSCCSCERWLGCSFAYSHKATAEPHPTLRRLRRPPPPCKGEVVARKRAPAEGVPQVKPLQLSSSFVKDHQPLRPLPGGVRVYARPSTAASSAMRM